MKAIGKVKINNMKPLNNEELLLLRGGYDKYLCVFTTSDGTTFQDFWTCPSECSPAEATQQCGQFYGYSASCDCGC